jgi:hypothetical protein
VRTCPYLGDRRNSDDKVIDDKTGEVKEMYA